ncbi:Chitinase [Paramyrothecium foliicola]|nr:Chitinase [Paramyrothecium foliicola]
MPTSLHPQAKFDPLPPDLDIHGLVERTPNFKWAQRVKRSDIRHLGQQDFEKLVLVHVILGGKPLVIDGWESVFPTGLLSADWLETNYDKKQENVRDIPSASDIPMTTGHYLRSMKQLTNQWTPNNFRDERRQRLYLKDIDCPPEWREALQKVIHPNLFYLNENVSTTGQKIRDGDGNFDDKASVAPAGDLMSSLPEEMRAENLMCYIGHEGTYTPAHREMCASLGQNIMIDASKDHNGEKAGSSLWFMTESKDREVVREYFLSMLGHDIEIEKHFAQINAWKKAPFDVYIVEQKPGDFILVPPLAAHQVWNRGTRTIKVAWNRTTAETLELALHEALPKARLVCRDEQYKNKAIIYFTLKKYYEKLQKLEEDAEKTQMSFIGLGQEIVRNSPRAKQLANDFKKLFALYTEVLVDEMFAIKEKDVEFVEYDSCVTCSYCRSNIFNRFLTCKNCIRTLVNGPEDAYDVCMECYAMGRSCACLSGLQWCEQWSWADLVDNYETWRAMVVKNDGFVDLETSPQPFEIARLKSGKKSVAQICQEALRRRPWKDITKPEREKTPSDSEPEGTEDKPKKKPKRKAKKGEVRRCHVCCHKDYAYRVHSCTNPDCAEGYCYGVLYRAFDMMPQKVLEDEHWQCPKCLGICNCGHCRRAGNANFYTPKNTSLGHDTRPIADDRSVEALVDFRMNNLSWLKVTGEESRSKDSRRMKRLREQADNAKAQDLTEQAQAEQQIQPNVDSNHSRENGAGNAAEEGVPHQGHAINDDGPVPHDIENRDHLPSQGDDMAAQLNSLAEAEGLLRDEVADESLYPDPAIMSHQRIGMGYYEQDDTADRILFDPYQAPSADAMRLDEPDVSEYVKKTIRAAKRKAKRDNEDPDFVVGKSHHKKPRLAAEPDYLNAMDPALFESGPSIPSVLSAPTVPTAPMEARPESQVMEAAVQPQSIQEPEVVPVAEAPKKAPRLLFDANEPELRHAKPKASYVEVEDGEADYSEPEEGAAQQLAGSPEPEATDGPQNNAVDLAANAVRALFGGTNAPKPQTSPPQQQVTTGKKRGRPPKRMSEVALVDSPSTPSSEGNQAKKPRGRPRKSLNVDATAQEGIEVADPQTGNDGVQEQAVEAASSQRQGRGRPRRTGVTTIAAATWDTASPSPEPSPNAPVSSRGRGRPRRSGPAHEVTPAQDKAVENSHFMSLAERMALRGKSFKIGKRKPSDRRSGTGSPAQNTNTSRPVSGGNESPRLQAARTHSVATPSHFDAEIGSASTVSEEVRRGVTVTGATVVRLSDPESGSEVSDESALFMGSSDGSEDEEDIPAKPIAAKSFVVFGLSVASCALLFGTMSPSWKFPAAALAIFSHVRPGAVAQAVDIDWHAPAKTDINDLDKVLSAKGVYGWIYDSSETPDDKYGTYNWCNMPHVRSKEYVKAKDEFKLQYVEVIHRHHKRTPYSSNAFPVEPYQWNCDEQGLYYYGEPWDGEDAARAYRQGVISDINPFVPSGWIGSCQFPQITAEGLDDSWQHGADLFGVYHDLLGFLPGKKEDFRKKVQYRVTNNLITSQVAGMLIKGMWDTTEPVPVLAQAAGVDGLEPQYTCSASSNLFNRIKSSSNAEWKRHLDRSASLYSTLDGISGVPSNDGGFHSSFDHYYDNLSARQCHSKPLPCKLVDGVNSTTCIDQELADAVYRMGHWEYSQIYRDSPDALKASAGSLGVWVAELAAHLREVIDGKRETIYFHNIAHDGSISRLLSILQLDEMPWPGMGAEVVFELYKKEDTPAQPTPTVVAPGCSRNNCLRQMIRSSAAADAFCPTFTASGWAGPKPTWPANCDSVEAISSACSCVVAPTATSTSAGSPSQTAAPSKSGYYIRVLWGGQVFKSSSPTLGLIDMLPVETLLAYFDGLVGERGSKVKANCQA